MHDSMHVHVEVVSESKCGFLTAIRKQWDQDVYEAQRPSHAPPNICCISLKGVTRVKYLTDGVLIREMMDDPLLSRYRCGSLPRGLVVSSLGQQLML